MVQRWKVQAARGTEGMLGGRSATAMRCGYVRSEKVCVDLGSFMHLHFLQTVSKQFPMDPASVSAYHLEIVQLLLNLLSKQRSQAVTSCDLAASVVFAAGPCLVKLNARTKHNVPGGLRSDRRTFRLMAVEAALGEKVVLARNRHRDAASLLAARLIVRSAGRARVGRVASSVDRPNQGRRCSRVGLGLCQTFRQSSIPRLSTGGDGSVSLFKIPFRTAARISARSLSPPTMLLRA